MRNLERALEPTPRELGTGFPPFSPLGAGILAGTITAVAELGADNFRNHVPGFALEPRWANRALVDLLQAVAAPLNVSLTGRMACFPEQHRWIVPIPGTTRLFRPERNLGGGAVDDRDLKPPFGAVCPADPVVHGPLPSLEPDLRTRPSRIKDGKSPFPAVAQTALAGVNANRGSHRGAM